ncbi:MAG: response regulator transcription factor [Pseudonocardiaceae bacterium]
MRGLTGRELDVLGLLIEGWSNARIAAALVIAPQAVAANVEHILAKLGAGTALGPGVRRPGCHCVDADRNCVPTNRRCTDHELTGHCEPSCCPS